jgi:hypothetical protein
MEMKLDSHDLEAVADREASFEMHLPAPTPVVTKAERKLVDAVLSLASGDRECASPDQESIELASTVKTVRRALEKVRNMCLTSPRLTILISQICPAAKQERKALAFLKRLQSLPFGQTRYVLMHDSASDTLNMQARGRRASRRWGGGAKLFPGRRDASPQSVTQTQTCCARKQEWRAWSETPRSPRFTHGWL